MLTIPAADRCKSLKKDIPLRSLFTLAFGTIIGVGWITVMGTWLTQAGSMGAILGFIGGGFVMLVVGLCYAEVAAMYPVSGGEVAYVYEIYGSRWCFVAGWFLAFTYIVITTFEAISVGWVLSALFPGFEGPVLYTALEQDVHASSLLAGLAIMGIVTVLNYRGSKAATRFQDVMTAILLAVTLVFVFFGVVFGDGENLEPMFVVDSSGSAVFGVLAVLATTPFWFAGFDTIPQAMGEVVEGAQLRLIAKVIALAIGVALLFYCLVILSASMSLPRAKLMSLELPVAGALEAAFNSKWMGKLVLVAGLCGLITTWNAIFFAGSRIVFSLSRGRMIPTAFSKVHVRFGSPFVAVLFVGGLGGVGALFGRQAILPIVNASAACLAFVFLLVVLGVARLRKTRPDHTRPYRLPGGTALPYLSAMFSLGLLIAALFEPYRSSGGVFPREWLVLLIWAAFGGVFWFAAGKVRHSVSERERRRLIMNGADF